MLNILAYYLLIGGVFIFSIEMFAKSKTFKKLNRSKEKIEFNNNTRILGIACWPLCLLIFSFNFFKEFFK